MEKEKLVIIGAGPAGLTAGIYAARAELKPLIIEGPTPGGQLISTSYVENWPGEKKILGVDLMIKMKEHAKEVGSKFLFESVIKVNLQEYPFTITTKTKKIIADAIILATGSSPKRLNCPGEEKYWGKGVTSCAVCDGTLYRNQPVIIIGGGDTAMEDASFMTKFTDDITIIQLNETLTASKAMANRALNNPKIKIFYNSSVTEIKGNETNATSVIIKNIKTNAISEIKANGIFVAIGMQPQTKFLENQIELDKWNYIKLKEHTKTSIPGVFAAGDVADFKYRQAITSAGSGCMAALDAEHFLTNRET